MSAKEEVYNKLLLISDDQKIKGFTASELEPYLGIKRNVISHYLNRLTDDGLLKKSMTRPVRYSLLNEQLDTCSISNNRPEKNNSSIVFNKFIGSKGSLAEQVEQCKSAVLYPPNGLSLLIRGKSGTGKSYLATLIHEYAIERKLLLKDAPFVVLNCADYANNPDLLSATLFGYIKGAFTGATENKTGLLDQANGGYLFLDEIHRLSNENQEKLFIFLDKGIFRRLGESENWRSSNVRFIFATTENVNEVLLETFRRRVPLTLDLPDLQQRPLVEKVSLIQTFFHQEAASLDKKIIVEPNVIDALVFSNEVGNVGSLKNHVKISCANAYKSQMEEKEIMISFKHLPRGLEAVVRFFSQSQFKLKVETADIVSNEESNILKKDLERDLTDFLTELATNKERNLKDAIRLLLNKTASHFNRMFGLKINNIDELNQISSFNQYVYDAVYKEVEELEEQYGIKLMEDDLCALITILTYFVHEPFDSNNTLINQMVTEIQEKYPKPFQLSEKLLLSIEKKLQRNYPLLHLVWPIAFIDVMTKDPEIQGIIVAHGKSTASSIASVANTLCEGYIFEPFDMPIAVESKNIIKAVNKYINKIDTSAGLILLVDMGSLQELYEPIKDNLNGDLLIVNNITTSMAIDIGLKIKQNKSLQYIIEDAKASFKTEVKYYEGISKGNNIIVSCISGLGIAKKLKEIIKKYIHEDKIEVLILDYNELKRLIKSSDISMFKQTKLIITTTGLDTKSIPSINIQDIVGDEREDILFSTLNGLVDSYHYHEMSNEIIKFFSIEGVTNRLNFLNPSMVINEVESVIKQYEEYYHIYLPNYLRINLLMHISILIERLMLNREITEEKIDVNQSQREFIIITKRVFQTITDKYSIIIPTNEILMIYELVTSVILEKNIIN